MPQLFIVQFRKIVQKSSAHLQFIQKQSLFNEGGGEAGGIYLPLSYPLFPASRLNFINVIQINHFCKIIEMIFF